MSHIQIAIDGPSGAGKSSLSKAVAKAMGIIYVDTGALYRTVGYFARSKGISLDNISALVPLLGEINIEVRYENEVQCVYLNGENLGDRIRENEISMYASKVSAIPEVRAFLLDTQKDIGTVILPDADVKIFLTASNEIRARRRVKELEEKGMPASFEEVLSDMIKRDEQDRSRDIAPAIAAPDAIHFDNSYEGFDEALEALLAVIRNAL